MINMPALFSGIYKNKTVLVTGHTGFKGSWLVSWLLNLGADVIGYSLEPPSEPNHYSLLDEKYLSIIGDIRDRENLCKVISRHKPDIVFHLAAQPIVRLSYQLPVETYETNVMGTLNVFEACRQSDSVRAIVNVTSDKCYKNKEWLWGYREDDPMGGYDPYSSSKGCSEILTASYRNSFFNTEHYGNSHNTLVASARAGNVIGGGDWAEDRLIPDIMRAAFSGKDVVIRSPQSTRPWQHVLEPLSGYLFLGQKLLEGETDYADAWNFGPDENSAIPVEEVVKSIKFNWDKLNYIINEENSDVHEATLLKLDCSKARTKLKWQSVWNIDDTFVKTVDWYREYYDNSRIITKQQITEYVISADKLGVSWAQYLKN